MITVKRNRILDVIKSNSQVRSHTRTSKTGKMSIVKQHSREYDPAGALFGGTHEPTQLSLFEQRKVPVHPDPEISVTKKMPEKAPEKQPEIIKPEVNPIAKMIPAPNSKNARLRTIKEMESTSKKSGISRYAAAAANIKAELKSAFPDIKFSVKSDSFSMGNSVDIRWDNGPTDREVKHIVDKYQYGSFDGMEDIYRIHQTNFHDTYGGSKYVSTHREISNDILDQIEKDYARLQGVPHSSNGVDPKSGQYFSQMAYKIASKTSFPAGSEYDGLLPNDHSDSHKFEDYFLIKVKMPDGKIKMADVLPPPYGNHWDDQEEQVKLVSKATELWIKKHGVNPAGDVRADLERSSISKLNEDIERLEDMPDYVPVKPKEQDPNPDEPKKLNAFEQRKLMRLNRLRELADKNRAASNRNFDSAHNILSFIPPGQPILVGHHSEKRHRSDLNKVDNAMRRASEAASKAEYYDRKADALESNTAISSNDPDAISKLEDKIKELRDIQDRDKKLNVLLRKAKIMSGDPDAINKMVSAGIEKPIAESLAKYLIVPGWEKRALVFPSYHFQNMNQNIRRYEQRLASLKREKSAPKMEISGELKHGASVNFNEERNGIELSFPGKPSDEIRQALHDNGFRWARTARVWYTRDTPRSRKWVDEYFKKSLSGAYVVRNFNISNLLKSATGKTGEGSRGGKVIGHTRSGKPIYDSQYNYFYQQHTGAAKEMDDITLNQIARDSEQSKLIYQGDTNSNRGASVHAEHDALKDEIEFRKNRKKNVIGITDSGKEVHNHTSGSYTEHVNSYKDYSERDHAVASQSHALESKKAKKSGDQAGYDKHRDLAGMHWFKSRGKSPQQFYSNMIAAMGNNPDIEFDEKGLPKDPDARKLYEHYSRKWEEEKNK